MNKTEYVAVVIHEICDRSKKQHGLRINGRDNRGEANWGNSWQQHIIEIGPIDVAPTRIQGAVAEN